MATKMIFVGTKPAATTGSDVQNYGPHDVSSMDQNAANLQAAVDAKAALAGSSAQDFATKNLSVTGSVTASGNANIGGATASSWQSGWGAIEVGYKGSGVFSNALDELYIGSNIYRNGGIWYRASAGIASYMEINNGTFVFKASSTNATPDTAATFSPLATISSTGLSVTGIVTPEADNTRTLGTGALRWSTVYAGTGTINTSDAREKTVVSALTANEINAAKQIAKEIGSYKWLSSVAEKGDSARCHIGLTVQKAISILEANSLDAMAYGFICYDKWDDVVVEHPAIEAVEAQDATFDEDGNELTPAVEAVKGKAAWSETTLKAGDRYSFRMDELNLFIAAGFEARLAALESK